MKINDTRDNNICVYWSGLIVSEAYVDAHGRYVMKTEEDAVVSLEDGCLYDDSNYELDHDTFHPVKARLEIE